MLPRVNLVRGNSADYLLFSTSDAISTTIYKRGGWAEPLITISRMFYDGGDKPLVLDIGANLGAYAIPVAQDLQKLGGTVYAYEAQRLIYYQLCGNLILNSLDNVHAFHLAIGDEEGTIEIPAIDYQSSDNIGGFSLDHSIREQLSAVAIDHERNSERVAMVRVDSISFPKAPDLIKIDVEGFEHRVLSGAGERLEEWGFPPLLLEAWRDDWFRERREQLMALLDRLGYEHFELLNEVIAQHPRHSRHVDFVNMGDAGLQLIRTR